MTDGEARADFRAADASPDGHLILSAGLRGPQYLRRAPLPMDPERAARPCGASAAKIAGEIRREADAPPPELAAIPVIKPGSSASLDAV